MITNIVTIAGVGLELKRRLGQGKFVVSQVQHLLYCSLVLKDTSLGES